MTRFMFDGVAATLIPCVVSLLLVWRRVKKSWWVQGFGACMLCANAQGHTCLDYYRCLNIYQYYIGGSLL